MNTEQRIDKIEQFIHTQRYIHGVQFRVDEDPDKDDCFVVTIAKASERQLNTLNHRFVLNGMEHIRAKAIEVIKYDPPKHKHKSHGKKH